MTGFSRRTLLKGTAASAGATVALPAVAVAEPVVSQGGRTPLPLTIVRGDPRYMGLTTGSNQRWVATPEHMRLVRTADEILWSVQEAVDSNRRIAVRSGGHTNENLSSNDAPVLIDLSLMDDIHYDQSRKAFAIEPGAMLGGIYRTLYKGWGVTIPGGTCPTVCAGGHIAGGGYGPLSRMHGLSADHLYAVELITVDSAGRAGRTVATREPNDPNRELWWAHTGAGGGSYGVVTRYWMRSPGTEGLPPEQQLPKPPAELIVSDVSWSWNDLDERSFTRLLHNYSSWYERNSRPDSPYAGLFSQLRPAHKSAGAFSMSTQIDAATPGAQRLLDEFLAAVNAGTGVTYRVNDRSTVPWLYAVREWFGFIPAATPRWKAKSAYMRKAFPESQLKAFYRHLTRSDYSNPAALVVLAGYGGKINTVAHGETATAQRSSVLKMLYVSLWTDSAQDEAHKRWVREFYSDVYAETGGVPGIEGVNDGAYINYADADLADPALNTSGTPWHRLYFKDGYSRMQRIKSRWDPRNVFSHALAVQP
jgi:hypothetical protein